MDAPPSFPPPITFPTSETQDPSPTLISLLRNITSPDPNLYTLGCKDFSNLLKSPTATSSQLLTLYVTSSPHLTELLDTWSRWKPSNTTLSPLFSLIKTLLSHPAGLFTNNSSSNNTNDVKISRGLDKFARVILEERFEDVLKEVVKSKDVRRERVGLLLIAAIVRRGSLLAADVAKAVDFKAIASLQKKHVKNIMSGRKGGGGKVRKGGTRDAFVEFAMSFVEVGKVGLVRAVLQNREVYAKVMRGLGSDSDETVVYVLSTLRDRVLLVKEGSSGSGVSPGLRSVLFGSVTLEQLASVASREGVAGRVAYEVLVKVCTEPENGLMPDLRKGVGSGGGEGLRKGNVKRVLGLIKKLKATEIVYHRDLVLAVVKGWAEFGSAYLDEFPYNLEDNASPTWVSAIILAANVVKSVREGISWDFLDHQGHDQAFENAEVQSVYRCICPRPLSRLVVNKGLLHSDPLIKHATLRVLLEFLKLLNSFIDALTVKGLSTLKQKVLDEVQILLPDAQVLFTLLSSLSGTYLNNTAALKRPADSENAGENYSAKKKLKVDTVVDDIDILVGGLGAASEDILPTESEEVKEALYDDEKLMEVWGSDEDSGSSDVVNIAEVFFYCKVLEAVKIFHGTFRAVLGVSYDFLKIFPSDPLRLPSILLQSFLTLLIEHLGCSQELHSMIQPSIYKHLQSFLNLWIQSSSGNIKEQAYVLAKASMRSSGAFDHNFWEVGAWFLFIPGYVSHDNSGMFQGREFFQGLASPVVSFLCDAVSTVGNSLVKYWSLLKCHISALEVAKGWNVEFSPLVICVLEKCLRLLRAESGIFKLPEKSLISLYVCNTLKHILQTQVEPQSLAAVINVILSQQFEDSVSAFGDAENYSCEWRPLAHLIIFSRSIIHQQTIDMVFADRVALKSNSSFLTAISEARSVMSASGAELSGVSKALYFTTICTATGDVLDNLPSLLSVSGELPGFHQLLMNYLYHDQSLVKCVSKLWPVMFSSGLGASLLLSAQSRQYVGDQISSKEKFSNLDSIENASGDFGLFLKEAPFYSLFPAIIFCDQAYLSEIKELLVVKLSQLTSEQVISTLRLVLFCFNQVLLSYKRKPSPQHESLLEVCYVLMKHIIAQTETLNVNSGSSIAELPFLSCFIKEVGRTVFQHPSFTTAFSPPYNQDYELGLELFKSGSQEFLHHNGQRMCKSELYAINILIATLDNLVALHSVGASLSAQCKETLVKVCRGFVQWILMTFKERFKMWCKSKDKAVFPVLGAILSLKRLISPNELLELSDWIFASVEVSVSTLSEDTSVSPVTLALSVASGAFDQLFEYLETPNEKSRQLDIFWVIEDRIVDVALYESVYLRVFEFVASFKMEVAEICLLKALRAACSLTSSHEFLRIGMKILTLVTSTAIKLVSHCMARIDITKAKLLSLMVDISPLHMSDFGQQFADTLGRSQREKLAASSDDLTLAEESYLILMPVAISCINSFSADLIQQSSWNVEDVLSFYSNILVDGFCNWKHFVSKTAFHLEYDNKLPCSVDKWLDLLDNSLLSQAVKMLQLYFCRTGTVKSERLKLFSKIYSESVDDFLDFDVDILESCSVGQLLNLVNTVVAKISLILLLYFPQSTGNGSQHEAVDEANGLVPGHHEEDAVRLKIFDMMVAIWQRIVRKFSYSSELSKQKNGIFLLFRSLEVFMLRCIRRLASNMHCYLAQMGSLSFLEKMAKVCLLHRFGDPTTLEALRHVITSLSGGKLPIDVVLQLLLGHSQLAPTIDTVIDSSDSAVLGMVVKPISSFLRSSFVPSTSKKYVLESSERHKGLLELIKLLRLLFHLKAQKDSIAEDESDVNARELVFLLLPAYGATFSEVDLEIHELLSEIESARESNDKIAADLDYLWGTAALRVISERAAEHALFDKSMEEDDEDRRRSQFRDNLPIDPKLLINTILHFPDRKIESQDSLRHSLEGHCEVVGTIQCYDPVYLLSFSVHSLSMGYLDPVEFASLGLLGVALVSLSSPDDSVRKLGYEVLGRFTDTLKGCRKKREATRLKLLLTYLQNGIDEPWQKIPRIAAIFVAEASVILLDPAHDHYPAVSNVLMQTPRMNAKSLPLFQDFIWSNSVNFRTERMWMLRLLHAGINLEDDAQTYIRNSVIEILMSVYASPLSDNEAKEGILQVVRKSVKVQKIAHHLVENCCLLSWLSSIILLSSNLGEGQDLILSKQLMVLLEVIDDIVSSRSITEWLQKHALVQLSDLSCHLFSLLVQCSREMSREESRGLSYSKLIKDAVPSLVVVLKVFVSTLEISQARENCQPHFTPSIWELYRVCQAIDKFDSTNSHPFSEFGLKAVLMRMPPTTMVDLNHLEEEELSQFLEWAVATALRSDSQKGLQKTVVSSGFRISTCEEHKQEETLMIKLLRWLVASVILQRFSSCHDSDPIHILRGAKGETLLSYLQHWDNGSGTFRFGDVLARTIFHLQQTLGIKCRILPSVVAALSVLLSDRLYTAGSLNGVCSENSLPSIWSKICFPSEANPTWKWSFYQPWSDVSTERTGLEKINETHACQDVLVIISAALSKKPLDYQTVSHEELQSSALFRWQRTSQQ